MAEIATNRTSSSDYSGEFFLFFSPRILPFVEIYRSPLIALAIDLVRSR